MSISNFFLIPIFLLLSSSYGGDAQSPSDGKTDFSCSTDTPSSCDTYLTYRARPPYLDLQNVSTLFQISPSNIAEASNIVSQDAQLVLNQLLLIPITCTCNGSLYFSNFTYKLRKGDSYYVASTVVFQNLTNFILVQDQNPMLDPVKLEVGQQVVFPLLCKCPSKRLVAKGFNYLITYVLQPRDDVLSVATDFNSTVNDFVGENSFKNFTAALCLPVLVPVPQLPILSLPKLPPRHKSKVMLAIILSLSGASLLILAGLSLHFLLSLKKKKTMNRNGSQLEVSELIRASKMSREASFDPPKLLPGVSGYLGKPIVYEKSVILESTKNLNERYRIGGSVYKATINDQTFAVKKTKDDSEELKMLQKVNHANLVKLVGVSSDHDGNCFLVYEYAENGSLDKWLYQNEKPLGLGFLTWTQRLNIALDVANGLQYMHDHTQPSMVHRDIRSTNILLNASFKAKISNFSLSRPATSTVMPKIDVFAFGIVLLELLSGRKAMETRDDGEIRMSWKEIRAVLEDDGRREGRLREWMDRNLECFYPIDGAMSLVCLARACTNEKYSERPRMAEVVFNLSVLAQSSQEMYERSWSGAEGEENIIQISNPVVAR